MGRFAKLSYIAAGLMLVAAPSQAQIMDLGDGGAFGAFIPNLSGRATSEFWDNASADQIGAARNCNVGFYAAGLFDAACKNQTAGTFANQGGYSYFYGKGAGPALGAPAFMFSGAHGYNLRLVGAVAGKPSGIGIFTRTATMAGGWTYTFTPIPMFGNKTINSTLQIGPGSDWGFYMRNTFNPQQGGCATAPKTWCTDANGNVLHPFQQFSLFAQHSNGGFGKYLVGVEDNSLELLPNGFFYDSDYQDYLIEVTATPEPVTMGLLATGLVGLAGVGFVKRRRERARQAD